MGAPVLNEPGHSLNGHCLHERETRLIEVLCKHGIGHPAPEHLQTVRTLSRPGWSTHGCDGCCLPRRV